MTDTGAVGSDVDLISPSRLHPILYILVVNHYATLKEIRDDYSVEEVLDLYEACMVNVYNRYQVIESSKSQK